MEFIKGVSDDVSSEFFKSPDVIKRAMPVESYVIRILDVNGKVLIEPFITMEIPVGLSKKYFLTIVNGVKKPIILKNGQQMWVERDYVIVRSLDNLEGNIMQIINPSQTLIREDTYRLNMDNEVTPEPDRMLCVTDMSPIYGVTPGPDDSFLIMYTHITSINFFIPNSTVPIKNEKVKGIRVVKYQYIPYKNVGELLDHKLE